MLFKLMLLDSNKDPMHKKCPKIFEKSPPQFDAEFPCDSRGGLRLAVSCKFEDLEVKTLYFTKKYI